MTATQKWTPEHWRSGCWVESYTRSNGVRVSRHWRSGGSVQSHYSLVNDPETLQGREPNRQPGPNHPRPTRFPRRTTAWPRSRTKSRTPQNPSSRTPNYIPLVLQPSANNAALAIALDQLGPYRVWPNPPRNTNHTGQITVNAGFARMNSVTWTNTDDTTGFAGELTLAANRLTIPPRVRKITLKATVTHPGSTNRELLLDTPIFFNADGTISAVPQAPVEPEDAVRMIKALEQRSDRTPRNSHDDEARSARIHNQVREQLGNHNPERYVRQAIAETVKLIPPPALNIEKTITIPCPNTSYVITISPAPPPEQNAGRRSGGAQNLKPEATSHAQTP